MNTAMPRRAAAGFTIVELMVTIALALFLIGGLLTIIQNVRQANINQQALAQLQDEQRFALTVMTDSIQSAGYFSDPVNYTVANFPVAAASNPIATNFGSGWPFTGFHTVGAADGVAQDSIATRFYTNQYAGPVLCNGTDTAQQPLTALPTLNQVQFGIDNVNQQLWCMVNNNNVKIPLVNGVKAMAVYYGVKRDSTTADYNIDTYVTWDHINQGSAAEMSSISAVRIVLTFVNPLANQAGQPPTITTERVIEVMGRAGPHT
ncbi:MAG: PilW family protein [Proteobacteria bacterium]|nr:PilW family protein [Pseudomonadota bacterium]